MFFAPERFDHVADVSAAGMPENKAGTDSLGDTEQIQFLPQFAVVALFGFFQTVQVRLEFFLIGECHAVDALEHFVLCVAAIVAACNIHEFERTDLDRVVHMRTTAEVDEVAALVERDGRAVRDIRQPFQFVVLPAFFKELLSFFAGHFGTGEGQMRLCDLFHFGFDLHQIFVVQCCSDIEVIVEAVSSRGTDVKLDIRVEFLNSSSHHVSGAVPDRFQRELCHFICVLSKKV